MKLNSNEFPKVYKELGISLDKLGCVMLDLEPLPALSKDRWLNLDLYTTKHPDRFWIKGWIADKHPHITLLYGLLKEAKEYKKQINEVLEGWEYKKAEIEDIGYFDSPYDDEPYYCIIAHIKVTPNLLEGNQRLEFLPHINTFPGYKPHMTIAYISKARGTKYRDMVINALSLHLIGKTMKVSGLNFGGNK